MAPRSIAVILNAGAGTALGRPDLGAHLTDLFRAAGQQVEIITLEPQRDSTDVVANAAARVDVVVAAGGDGTVCTVASGVLGSPAALGILPLGTLNHFAKDLRIPFGLPEAIAVIVAGRVQPVDVGLVNDRVFVNNSSIGIYPSIVHAREALRSRGHRKWPAMAIATLRVLRHARGMRVTLEIDAKRRTWRTPFIFVGNNEYAIDGIGLGGRARLDQGKLFVYFTPRIHARDLPLLLIKALFGHARQSGEFEIVSADDVWIDTVRAGHVEVASDGEVTTMKTPLHFRARPGALRVLLPRD